MTEHHPSEMEPMLPSEGDCTTKLEDLAVELISKNERLKANIHPITQNGLGDMLRNMNCYYSNFIEGHNTHPIDIERALQKDYSSDIKKQNLQLEAKSHIELQQKIDQGLPFKNVTSPEFFLWLHKEFCSNLPQEMLTMENPETKETKILVPGKFRDGNVIIGYHIPIPHSDIPKFLTRFQERYDFQKLGKLKQVIVVAASHHRFLWIHPFYDANGRVARLFSHAFLKQIGLRNSLWSISRGLARNHIEYKQLLMDADSQRQGNYDGRGALTQKGLNAFCEFFIKSCLDQIDFMENLLTPSRLLQRIERWAHQKIDANELPQGSFALLKEAFIHGQFERGEASRLTLYKERQARTVLSTLIKKGLLISDKPKGPVRLVFPSSILEDWFPRLFLG